MNGVAYEGKRAHWCFVWFMTRAFRAAARNVKHRRSVLSDMTPARYDVLHAVFRRAQWQRRNRSRRPLMPFASLVRKLGLAISTVSEMVRRMHELGLVRRFKSPADRRVTIVQITNLGVKCFHAAQRAVRFAKANLARILGDGLMLPREFERVDGRPCEKERAAALDDVAAETRLVASYFGSRAEPMYAADYLEDCNAPSDLFPWTELAARYWRERDRPRVSQVPTFAFDTLLGGGDDDGFDDRI